MLDFQGFELLSFDCYGTLIDWESGILSALKPVLARHGQMIPDEDVLALYARAEPQAEHGEFASYREVLRRTMDLIAKDLSLQLTDEQRNALVDSLPNWQPFADTVEALQRLKERYRLAIISNVDDDLFAETAKHLHTRFDHVVTALSVGAYKPSLSVFEAARDRFAIDDSKWLHVAQSRFHDIAPAHSLGLRTVHVDRRAGRSGGGATPASTAEPDLVVESLAQLADRACK